MCQHDPTMTKASLYVVPGSHPCATAARALELKGIPFRTIELPPGMHAAFQKVRFGKRTVPGLKMGRRRISGSREILRALDIVRPEPPLLPADTNKRTRVLEAEAWGDEVLQAAARRIIWGALPSDPAAAHSYLAESRLPFRPGATQKLMPATAWMERRLNRLTDARLRADLEALPGWLDRVDAWIADGTIGGEPPNAADLQIAPSIRMLATLDDLEPVLAGRPSTAWAHRLFPHWPGSMPPGSLPPASSG
jgi:glutathione S-transferase